MLQVDDRKPTEMELDIDRGDRQVEEKKSGRGSVQASIVYQFHSIEILQCELDAVPILIELVDAGGSCEDMSILRCWNEETYGEPGLPSKKTRIPWVYMLDSKVPLQENGNICRTQNAERHSIWCPLNKLLTSMVLGSFVWFWEGFIW
jgi:hypothetical protein